ncbi:MAG: hypothetical protein H6576_17905 [Lewinellaceae bacterium]|nr:hypothetical protein [Saprospiraceae bacterium]MCB9345569.1 hypothetical protein [Lewinellaceae bacterium]
MIRSLVKLALLLVAAILVYNYLFGTSQEKENSRKVFGQLREVVVSVTDLVKAEKEKFDAGKYDVALKKLGNAYKAVREQAQYVDDKVIKRLDDLETRKSALEQELESIDREDHEDLVPQTSTLGKGVAKGTDTQSAKSADRQQRKEALQREIDSLIRDTDQLMQDAQQ